MKMSEKRVSKTNYYLSIAKAIASRSPCSRKQFGAILVKDDAVIATGYNGSARGTVNCGLEVSCLKDLYDEESAKSYEHCPAVHAEMNVIINAARAGISTVGATLYLAEMYDRNDRPCFLCRRLMIQAGIKDVYYYKLKIDTKFHKITPFKYSNTLIEIFHEEVSEWVKFENEWMKDQLDNAGKKQ